MLGAIPHRRNLGHTWFETLLEKLDLGCGAVKIPIGSLARPDPLSFSSLGMEYEQTPYRSSGSRAAYCGKLVKVRTGHRRHSINRRGRISMDTVSFKQPWLELVVGRGTGMLRRRWVPEHSVHASHPLPDGQ